MSDVKLERCPSKKGDQPQLSDSWVTQSAPRWKELVNNGATYQVTFDMLDDLISPLHDAFTIKKNTTRKLRYRYSLEIKV